MGPERIRALRGDRTRTELARLLGVTPLTVLRWELPDGNKEARRPRRAMVEALERLEAEAARSPASVAFVPDADLADDMRALAPLRSMVTSADWRRAQDELLALLATNGLKSSGGRALATIAIAQLDMLARLDIRGALTAIMPLLAEADAGRLPPPVAARVHVCAAFLFSAPDARLFDPGRVNAHAAAASALLDPGAQERILLTIAKLSSRRFLGTEVFMQTYREAAHLSTDAPIPRCVLDLLKSIGAEISGETARGSMLSTAALDEAERLGLYALAVGAIANNVVFELSRCAPLAQVLEHTARARRIAEDGRLGPIEPLIRVHAAECEAFARLARFDEARATARAGRDLAARAGVPPYAIAAAAARLYCFTRDHESLASLEGELDKDVAPSMRALARGNLAFVRASAASLRGEYALAAELADEAWTTLENVAAADHVVHDVLVEALIACALGSDIAGARVVLRRSRTLADRLPSPWHAALLLRLEGLVLVAEDRMDEAIAKLEASLPPIVASGDLVQSALGRSALAVARHIAGVPGADRELAAEIAEVNRLGVTPRPIAKTLIATRAGPPFAGVEIGSPRSWALADRLGAAAARLSTGGGRPDVVRAELVQLAEEVLPGKRAILEEPERPSAPPPRAGQWFELVDERGKTLRFGVEGPIDDDQAAALRALASVARRGFQSRSQRPTESPVELEPELLPELPAFVAAGPEMQRLRRSIAQLSGSRATILITGESGSGKEVVARAIHDLSTRAPRPYVAFNCAAIPRDLFESHLFGHKKGSFTGAASDELGVVRAADKGTLFLDEIGELPLDVQPKLLRFLENGEVFPLGERRPIRVDVRVVAATHRDLAKLVRDKSFREDLFYRLNVVPLTVPPLRDRPEDVLALTLRFIGAFTPEGSTPPSLAPDALEALAEHAWPGNVRELRNVVERTMAFGIKSPVLRAADLRFA